MRLLPLTLAVFLLGLIAPARAQIFQIEVDGVFSSSSGVFSTVPAGTPYTFEATFNAANATLLSSNSYSATYVNPSGTSSFSFAGSTYTGIAPQILVTSNQSAGGVTLYGFEFSQLLSTGGYAVQLLSTDSSVAPTTSLSSVHAETFSEYQNSLDLGAYNGGGNDFVSGTNTSFSVQVQSAPEPSSVALTAFAVLLFGWLRRRQVCTTE